MCVYVWIRSYVGQTLIENTTAQIICKKKMNEWMSERKLLPE